MYCCKISNDDTDPSIYNTFKKLKQFLNNSFACLKNNVDVAIKEHIRIVRLNSNKFKNSFQIGNREISIQENRITSAKIKQLFNSIKPTVKDYQIWGGVSSDIEAVFNSNDVMINVIKSIFLKSFNIELQDTQLEEFRQFDISLRQFGSTLSNLSIANSSDMDFNLHGLCEAVKRLLPKKSKTKRSNDKKGALDKMNELACVEEEVEQDINNDLEDTDSTFEEDNIEDNIEHFAQLLHCPKRFAIYAASKIVSLGENEFVVIETVLSARIPVLKLRHEPSNTEVDVTAANELAVHNSLLLKAYADFDERVRPLIYCVKYWAKRRKVCYSLLDK